jgi:hypothetical protein
MFGLPSSGSMPLYLLGNSTGDLTNYMPLWVEGTTHKYDSSIPLYLGNYQSGVTNYIPLFVQGSGLTDGAYPFSASMPLFIKRPISEYLPLFIGTHGYPSSGAVYLYTEGCFQSSGTISLYTFGIGTQADQLPFFTAGF